MNREAMSEMVARLREFKELIENSAFAALVCKHYEEKSGMESGAILSICKDVARIEKKFSRMMGLESWISAGFFSISLAIIIFTKEHELELESWWIIFYFISAVVVLYPVSSKIEGYIRKKARGLFVTLQEVLKVYDATLKLQSLIDPQILHEPQNVLGYLHALARAKMLLEGSENPHGDITVIWNGREQMRANQQIIRWKIAEINEGAFKLKITGSQSVGELFQQKVGSPDDYVI